MTCEISIIKRPNLLGQLCGSRVVEQAGHEAQVDIQLVNVLHELPDKYPARLFRQLLMQYLCVPTTLYQKT